MCIATANFVGIKTFTVKKEPIWVANTKESVAKRKAIPFQDEEDCHITLCIEKEDLEIL